MKFHFRLDGLLRIRRNARDERRVELAEAERTDARLRDQSEQLNEERNRLRGESRRAAGPGPVDLARWDETQRYDALLRRRELQLREERQTLAEQIQQRRLALVEADAQVRVLEKLRENRQEAIRQEEHRKESKQLDEAALLTATREAL